MKKAFFGALLALVTLVSFQSEAQVASMKATLTTTATTGAVSGATEVTVTNTGTDTLFTPKVASRKLAGFVATFTETSGTSGGTATLQGSLDGTDWVTVGSAYTVTDVATATTTFKVLAADNYYNYFRIIYAGTGTMVNKMKVKYSIL